MDSEKKESAVLDDDALEAVSGGSMTVGEDGSAIYECTGKLPDESKCTGTVVFAPGEMTAWCPVCGGCFRQRRGGFLTPA